VGDISKPIMFVDKKKKAKKQFFIDGCLIFQVFDEVKNLSHCF
jgi:hypothetical protein